MSQIFIPPFPPPAAPLPPAPPTGSYALLADGTLRRDDGALIPPDPTNADYQVFLAWQAAGGTLEMEAPPVIRIRTISPRQMLLALTARGIITQAEALAAAQIGAIPAAIAEAFASLPPEAGFAASITWARMTEVSRDSPLVALLGQSLGLAETALDAFFAEAAAI